MEEKKNLGQKEGILVQRQGGAERGFFIFGGKVLSTGLLVLVAFLLFQNLHLRGQLKALQTTQSAMRSTVDRAERERTRAVDLNEKLSADLVSNEALLKRLELQRKGANPE